MRSFRYKKWLPVSYDLQGYIHFCCKRYKRLPAAERRQIQDLCQEAGGEYAKALMEYLTTDAELEEICSRYYCSDFPMRQAINRFYRLAGRNLPR